MTPKPPLKLFAIQYRTSYEYGPFAARILDSPSTFLQRKVLETYKARDRTALWISMFSNTTAYKRVIRVAASRKLRATFREALAENGYSAEGRSLQAAKGNLRGSLVFYPTHFMEILNGGDVLKDDMQNLVRWLEARQQGEAGGKPERDSGDGGNSRRSQAGRRGSSV